jgi:hypothetical protein
MSYIVGMGRKRYVRMTRQQAEEILSLCAPVIVERVCTCCGAKEEPVSPPYLIHIKGECGDYRRYLRVGEILEEAVKPK